MGARRAREGRLSERMRNSISAAADRLAVEDALETVDRHLGEHLDASRRLARKLNCERCSGWDGWLQPSVAACVPSRPSP
jgi:hypothetical protein